MAVALSTVAAGPVGAHDPGGEEPVLTFVGGGWGHGIGLSQYGAYGRATEGHTYDQILAHYYADTAIVPLADTADPTLGDDVDVRIAVRSIAAVSTPIVDGEGEPGWEVTVMAGDEELGRATRPVEAEYVGGTWQARALQDDDTVVDLCTPEPELCSNVELRIAQTGGSHVVIGEHRNGPNIGKYSHGEIILRPAALAGPACGSGGSFCVIHGGLSMEEYLEGIAEVPTSWPTEALKAQAVAARSYAASRIRDRADDGLPYDLVDSVMDQVYAGWARSGSCGGWCEAVEATAGEVVVHEGEIATTFYSSSNGGHSTSPVDVWDNGKALPYLVPRPDPFDDNPANPNGSWAHTYTVDDVSRWLNAYVDPDEGDQLHVGTVERIVIENVPESGRINYATVTIHGSKKTVEVLRDGEPYGYRFFYALRQGCLADDDPATPKVECDALLSTKFVIVAFHDISFSDYFYSPVQWMTAEGLTTGVAPNRFAPSDHNTRGQIATFLWRFAGKPEPTGASGFDDVPDATYFTDAVAWMAETGITTGTTPTTFSPGDTVSRGQAATFLWRFAGSPGSEVDTGFTDVAEDRYYTEAVRWMVEWDITTGTSPTTFSPDAPLTRGQIATFLWRLAGRPGAFAEGVPLPDAMRAT